MPAPVPPFRRAIQRIWQPQRGLFWLMLVFNALSSALAWTLHLLQPTGGLLVLLTLFALANTAMGWWLLAILWRTSAEPSTQGDPHVQSPARQQDR
jgi:uncharacterized membrane protein HdeD (DUF308 family)